MINTIDNEILVACGTSIAQGKKYQDALLEEYPMFGRFTGKFLHPGISHICTDTALSQNLSGIPGVTVTEGNNGVNYFFLEIETEHFYMTTSYVRECTTVPRYAHFRRARALSNRTPLFPEYEEQRLKDKPYLIFVHGMIEEKIEGKVVYEKLFGGIGMPCGDDPARWNDFIHLTDFIRLPNNIPEETIDASDPGFLKLKKIFMGTDDNNDSA